MLLLLIHVSDPFRSLNFFDVFSFLVSPFQVNAWPLLTQSSRFFAGVSLLPGPELATASLHKGCRMLKY